MAKFRFPLQKVLQHRKTLESLAQKDFEIAQAELNSQISKLEEMNQAKVNARDQAFRRQSEGGTASPALLQVADFLKGQDIRMERQRERIKECESLVENLREILRQKAIDYKIIEGLKDRKKQEFKVEQNKREQKLVDEMNVMRYKPEEVEE